MDAYALEMERVMKRLCRTRAERTIVAGGMRPSRPRFGWDMVGLSALFAALGMRPQDHPAKDNRNWKGQTLWTAQASPEKGAGGNG